MTEKPTIHCPGRCDGMGDLDANGSYVRIIYRVPGVAEHYIKLSEGEAAQLADEINAALASPSSLHVTSDDLSDRTGK